MAINEKALMSKLMSYDGAVRAWSVRYGSWDMMLEAWVEDMEASNRLVSAIKKIKEVEEISVGYIIDEL